MATTCGRHGHDHRRQARLAVQSGDPTRTRTIRENFRRELKRRMRRIRGAVRNWSGYTQDVFGLRAEAAGPQDVYEFESDAGKTQAFIRWLRQKLREEVLEPAPLDAVRQGTHWTATYIRAAYGRGWESGTGRLQQEGADIGGEGVDVFNLPVPRRQLRRLYTRTFENLRSITDEAADPVRDTLTEGLAAGWNPRKMARKLTKDLRSVEHTRMEVLARTEVINSHAEATLDRYERAGQRDVTVSGEFATADDDRVCPLCNAIEGDVFDVSEMRESTFTFEPGSDEPDHLAGQYPVKPPVHPQCRCTILPVVGA